jgi:hypothetical protein
MISLMTNSISALGAERILTQAQRPHLSITLIPAGSMNSGTYPGMRDVRLLHILQQVRKDGFHVEYIRDLGWQNAEIGEIIASVNRWAAQLSLKVSINRERGIFFFER